MVTTSSWSYKDFDHLQEQFKRNHEQRQLMAQQSAVGRVHSYCQKVFDKTQPAQPLGLDDKICQERPISHEKEINIQIMQLYQKNDIIGIVQLFEGQRGEFSSLNIATTLHRIATYYENQSETVKASMLKDLFILRCIDNLKEKAHEKIEGCSPQSLSNIAWALATMKSYDQVLFNAIARASIKKIKIFNPFDLSLLAWAFAKLNRFHESLFNAIARASIEKIKIFKPIDLATLVWAFATLHTYDPELFDAIARASILKIGDFTPQGLVMLAWAFAKLNQDHKDLFNAIATASTGKIGNFSFQELSTTAWAFVVVKCYNTSLFAAINKRLQSLNFQETTKFHNDNLLQMYHVFLVLDREHTNIRLNVPNILEDKIKQMLREKEKEKEKPDSSQLHEDILKILRYELKYVAKQEWFQDGLFTDIELLDSKATVIEVDGPHHFIRNTQQRLGNDLFRERILLARCRERKILHVPYFDWDSLRTKESKINYLRNLIDGPHHFIRNTQQRLGNDLFSLHVPYFDWDSLRTKESKINYLRNFIANG